MIATTMSVSRTTVLIKGLFLNMTVNMYVVEEKTRSMTLDQFYYNLHKLCFVSTRYYSAN